MATSFYFDSSALVKRYLNETGTAWVKSLCDPATSNEVLVVAITGVEVISAVTRRYRGGAISATDFSNVMTQFRQDFNLQFAIVEVTSTLLAEAMDFAENHGLRAYDSVQLAAMHYVHERRKQSKRPPVTLVSSDLDLNNAATPLGIPVDDPNNHP